MEILLTIAIPTIEQRKDVFEELYNELKRQAKPYGEKIEIIYLSDNKEISIGKKRQLLNEMANGKYVVHWDDDDWIKENAIDMIMEGIESDCDVISYNFFANVPEGFPRHSYNHYYSIQYDFNPIIDDKKKCIFISPSINNVIKTKIAKSVKFYDIRYQEEAHYRKHIKPLLKTEYHIDEFLYLYLNKTHEGYDDINNRFGIKQKIRLI
jgi:hypothetical protein